MQHFKIYNTLLNIIIIVLGNISINPQLANVELAGFWSFNYNIVSAITEFSIKLYESIFTNIIKGNPKIVIESVDAIKGSPVNIDLAKAFKLEEPEDLPTLDGNTTDQIYWHAYKTVTQNLKRK